MGNIVKDGGLVMLLHYGLIKVLRVEAYMQGTIRLAGLCEQRYLLCRMWNRCDDSLSYHVIKHILDLFPVFYEYLASDMLYGKDIGVCPDGTHPRHVANGVEGVGKGSLQCHYVLDLGCRVRGSCLGSLHLKGRLGWACSIRGEVVYKCWLYGVAGDLCWALVLCEELWLTFGEAVFLMLWWLVWDGVLQCSGASSTMGSWKVTVLWSSSCCWDMGR